MMNFTLPTETINDLMARASQKPFRALVRLAYSDLDPVRLGDTELVSDILALTAFSKMGTVSEHYMGEGRHRMAVLEREALRRELVL